MAARFSPRYSVVIPAYNAAAYIGETISSVLGQTETDWELVVVDDGSADETVAAVKGFADPRITLIQQENRGVSAARNRGFAGSRGEYVLFLDNDDLLYPKALERLGKKLDAQPEAVLAYGTHTCFEEAAPPVSAARAPLSLRRKPRGEALAALLAGNSPLLPGATLVRREAAARAGGFDPAINLNEDWVFWCDLAALGPIRYIGPEPLMAHRFHRGNFTRTLCANPRAPWPGIDRAFAREPVRRRFSAKKLARLRRGAEATALASAGRELVRQAFWREARRALWDAVKRDPAKPGYWVLLVCALIGRLPRPARRLFRGALG